ncbi:hypothetical protein DCAR_0414473 [Daucus carota subsp. sativus]|uniref:Uncharacterized protein n=1 Tax=Daucus carota subsp. sativus TaxID=79200 RepID=A0A175YAW4_DAUCS|nr:hypothetical protein DCAR_0414473 [Daucus carota subsp. sativus]
MINGEIEKLFFVNPKGALREFSRLQYNAFSGEIGSNYDWVVAVDGAVSKSQATKGKAGIGGVIRNKECRLIYVFSGPSIANQVFEVEMDACMYVMSSMDPSWVPPKKNFVKINIRASTIVDALQNGNVNSIGILARNDRGKYLWGIMSPMKNIGFLELQLWAIHKAMITAFRKNIPRVILETDNVHSYDITLEQDEELIEEEGLVEVLRQINNPSRTYNGMRQEDNSKWDCELVTVDSSRNRAALCMAHYGMSNCSSLVEVPEPFAELKEHLDIDMGFGPHAEFLEVQPNFGEGELLPAEVGRRGVVEIIDLTSEGVNVNGRAAGKGKQKV